MPYTFDQLVSYAEQGGFPSSVAPTMAAIALAESSGNNVVQKGQPYATTGWGLWQITPGNSVPSVGSNEALLDPVANARAAYSKYQKQGLNAWTTYRDGTYQKYLAGPSSVPGAAAGATAATSTSTTPSILFAIPGLGDLIDAAAKLAKGLDFLTLPTTWVRIIAGNVGAVLVLLGIIALMREAKAS